MAAVTEHKVIRWPAGASDDYIQARDALLEAEWALSKQIEAVAAQRRKLPPGPLIEKDYTFTEAINPSDPDPNTATKETTLTDLVADGRNLIVYHMMFAEAAETPCAGCAALVDPLDSVARHIEQHATFVVIGRAPLATMRSFARERGWLKARLLSSYGSEFNVDMNVEKPLWAPGTDQQPGISVFLKDGESGKVRHWYSQTAHFDKDTIRAMDLLSPIWNVFDILPGGRPDWNPKNKYA